MDDEVIWAEFRYEMLPASCYYCGIISHVEKFCHNKMEDSRKERVREGEYGEWMRANLLNVGKNGENVLGLARTESEKILRGHRLRKNGEEELREEARRTGRVPKKGDSSRIEGL